MVIPELNTELSADLIELGYSNEAKEIESHTDILDFLDKMAKEQRRILFIIQLAQTKLSQHISNNPKHETSNDHFYERGRNGQSGNRELQTTQGKVRTRNYPVPKGYFPADNARIKNQDGSYTTI